MVPKATFQALTLVFFKEWPGKLLRNADCLTQLWAYWASDTICEARLGTLLASRSVVFVLRSAGISLCCYDLVPLPCFWPTALLHFFLVFRMESILAAVENKEGMGLYV